ncbi:MAG: M15 family metallopeptidase [Candidatus Margulisbacteria bacterium]|jgi:D-alanyl-D-alanine carboxypeptidase|nr:M15 family metallopeptidase [Candidatus Margulisiibacteriota bacterium]
MAERLPPEIIARIRNNPKLFLTELKNALASGTGNFLLTLIDKKRPLPDRETKPELTPLASNRGYVIDNHNYELRLSPDAEAALHSMAEELQKNGMRLYVRSAYRDYAAQNLLYQNAVKTYGQAAADRESARSGASQHHTGNACDFSLPGQKSYDDFTSSQQYRWLSEHAWEYGWSNSYPAGCEEITGYRPESWHWRYLGKPAAKLERDWFTSGGQSIQQLMLEFMCRWQNP